MFFSIVPHVFHTHPQYPAQRDKFSRFQLPPLHQCGVQFCRGHSNPLCQDRLGESLVYDVPTEIVSDVQFTPSFPGRPLSLRVILLVTYWSKKEITSLTGIIISLLKELMSEILGFLSPRTVLLIFCRVHPNFSANWLSEPYLSLIAARNLSFTIHLTSTVIFLVTS